MDDAMQDHDDDIEQTVRSLFRDRRTKYVLPVGVLITIMMKWGTAENATQSLSVTGLNTNTGLLCAVVAIGILCICIMRQEHTRSVQLIGGGIITIVGILQVKNIQDTMSEAMNDGVLLTVGVGLYLMILLGALIIVSGYLTPTK